jgi:hypothetical protein
MVINDYHLSSPDPAVPDRHPDRILRQCYGQLTKVVICGYDRNGNEFFATNLADAMEVVWLMERYKHHTMHIIDAVK